MTFWDLISVLRNRKLTIKSFGVNTILFLRGTDKSVLSVDNWRIFRKYKIHLIRPALRFDRFVDRDVLLFTFQFKSFPRYRDIADIVTLGCTHLD